MGLPTMILARAEVDAHALRAGYMRGWVVHRRLGERPCPRLGRDDDVVV